MGFKSTILVVEDVCKSRKLYEDILDCKVVDDFGEFNVGYEGGLALYKKTLFTDLTSRTDITLKANNLTVYFEFHEMDKFVMQVVDLNLDVVHPVQEQPWGQNVFRFYDFDGHMIEIAESMDIVFTRLQSQGMTIKEMAQKTGFSEDAVKAELSC